MVGLTELDGAVEAEIREVRPGVSGHPDALDPEVIDVVPGPEAEIGEAVVVLVGGAHSPVVGGEVVGRVDPVCPAPDDDLVAEADVEGAGVEVDIRLAQVEFSLLLIVGDPLVDPEFGKAVAVGDDDDRESSMGRFRKGIHPSSTV